VPAGAGRWGDADRDRFGVLDLHDGQCRGAVATDRRGFEQAPFRLSAPYDRWDRLLHGRGDAMRGILLGEVRLDGDRLTGLRYLPAAKAMLDAMASVEVDMPVA
jgi:putative sterol carrier protein